MAKYLGFFEVEQFIQEQLFIDNGLDRTAALKRLNQILTQEFAVEYNEQAGMFSEHLIMFAAISLAHPNITNILEIGTYDGRTALILARLFPSANIVTMDLPEDDAAFSSTYDRKYNTDDFLANRNRLIARAKNVNFQATNSLNLCNSDDEFELIWVDGAHGYPTIACDITNSIRLLSSDGILMIDDVWTSIERSDANYRSVGGYETINALYEAGVIQSVTLFHKRLRGIYNHLGAKKHVAFIGKYN